MNNKILHLFRQSPKMMNDVDDCIHLLNKNDSVVLLDDGCYLACHIKLEQLLANAAQVFMVKMHAKARAIPNNADIIYIDISQLNTLIFSHQNSMTWQ